MNSVRNDKNLMLISFFLILCSIGWMYYGERTNAPSSIYHAGLILLIIGTILGAISIIRTVI